MINEKAWHHRCHAFSIYLNTYKAQKSTLETPLESTYDSRME
jgi:hypothetical protein